MRLLNSFQDKMGFTRKESIAILVLSATFLIGMGIRWVKAKETQVPEGERFDYSLQDSIYYEKSRAAFPQRADTHQVPSPQTKQQGFQKTSRTININTATKTQLMSLPGIGSAYADRIIEYRESHGTFTSIEDLANVKGIGKKKMEKLRPLVVVR